MLRNTHSERDYIWIRDWGNHPRFLELPPADHLNGRFYVVGEYSAWRHPAGQYKVKSPSGVIETRMVPYHALKTVRGREELYENEGLLNHGLTNPEEDDSVLGDRGRLPLQTSSASSNDDELGDSNCMGD